MQIKLVKKIAYAHFLVNHVDHVLHRIHVFPQGVVVGDPEATFVVEFVKDFGVASGAHMGGQKVFVVVVHTLLQGEEGPQLLEDCLFLVSYRLHSLVLCFFSINYCICFSLFLVRFLIAFQLYCGFWSASPRIQHSLLSALLLL